MKKYYLLIDTYRPCTHYVLTTLHPDNISFMQKTGYWTYDSIKELLTEANSIISMFGGDRRISMMNGIHSHIPL